jgi:hypothetical protein
MSDTEMGQLFGALREASKTKRASNREKSAERLQAANIGFVAKNGGAHLIVAGHIDFWPGTGKWQDRNTPDGGRGVRALIQHIEKASAS